MVGSIFPNRTPIPSVHTRPSEDDANLATHDGGALAATPRREYCRRAAVRDVCDVHCPDLRPLRAQQSCRMVGRGDYHDLALDSTLGRRVHTARIRRDPLRHHLLAGVRTYAA